MRLIALAAAKGDQSLSQLSARFGVHPTQIANWRKELLDRAAEIFADRRGTATVQPEVGRLRMELDWLKKKLPASRNDLRQCVDPEHAAISVRRQCELLGLGRSTWYYESVPETAANLRTMRLIDEQYLETPFYGARRMVAALEARGELTCRKRVTRLMRLMGLEAVGPRPRTTRRDSNHRVFPYLLRNVDIVRRDQVWSTDITYVPMPRGYLYLTAVMDWYSRYVLSWRLSDTLEGSFCLDALEEALHRGTPEIFNTDQGSQFTSRAFTTRLEDAGVAISMDGRGRALDNVFIERLWRSVKHESVYLHGFRTASELEQGLHEYFEFYCHRRPHQGLENRTPANVYKGRRKCR